MRLEKILGLEVDGFPSEPSFTPLLEWIDAARDILAQPVRPPAGELPTTCAGEIVNAVALRPPSEVVVGFTGTQHGMTPAQRAAVAELVEELQPTSVHHGDCIGADEGFDTIARRATGRPAVWIHPPSDDSKRAHCEARGPSTVLAPLGYLARNRVIVRAVDALIAAPKTMAPELRSGTWATIREAWKAGTPVHVVWPNGFVEKNRPAYGRPE